MSETLGEPPNFIMSSVRLVFSLESGPLPEVFFWGFCLFKARVFQELLRLVLHTYIIYTPYFALYTYHSSKKQHIPIQIQDLTKVFNPLFTSTDMYHTPFDSFVSPLRAPCRSRLQVRWI